MAAAAIAPQVEIGGQGRIQGVRVGLPRCDGGDVIAYLGIPFAHPPVGERRWRRAQGPAPSWRGQGVRRSEWRADPYQMLDMIRFSSRLRCDDQRQANDGSYDEGLISEDCLYLNIWVPETDETKVRPVLVWIYGGGFQFGASSQPQYDGARLAAITGCIVVSIAYRVTLFGFLGSRRLAQSEGQGAGTGNYALWDIVAGLQWVQESIAAFGGDPESVTAFGESAGAVALHYLMLSPAVPSNLFSRAGLFSATAASVLPRSMASAEATFDALVEALGGCCDAGDEEKVALLKNASARSLLEAFVTLPGARPRTEYIVAPDQGRPSRRVDHDHESLRLQPSSLPGPTWDGVMVSEQFLDCLMNNAPPHGTLRNGHRGVFFGHTADEGTVFTVGIATKIGLERSLRQCNPSMRAELERIYRVHSIADDESARIISSAILGDYAFVAPVTMLNDALIRQREQVPAYRYLWTHRPSEQLLRSVSPNPMVDKFFGSAGSYHSGELAFLFNWDPTETRTYARQSFPQGNEFHRRMVRGIQSSGMTSAERQLAITFARHLAAFAHGQAPWKPLESPDLEKSTIMVYDDMPSLGTWSEKARRSNDGSGAIPTLETTLGETSLWQAPVDPDRTGKVGTFAQKYQFWSDQGFARMLAYYYGDERYGRRVR